VAFVSVDPDGGVCRPTCSSAQTFRLMINTNLQQYVVAGVISGNVLVNKDAVFTTE
jgi:hypothetical protein